MLQFYSNFYKKKVSIWTFLKVNHNKSYQRCFLPDIKEYVIFDYFIIVDIYNADVLYQDFK